VLSAAGLNLSPTEAAEAASAFQLAEAKFGHLHDRANSLWLRPISVLPWAGDQVRAVRNLSDMGVHAARAGDMLTGALAGVPQEPLDPGARSQPGQKILQLLQAIDPKLSVLSSELDSVVADRGDIPHAGLLPPLARAVAQLDRRVDLPAVRQAVLGLREDEPGIRALLGATASKSYLVLQQDPAELRATGGFIGSVGFLAFDHGSMAPFSPEDIEKIDKTSTGAFVLGGPGTPNHVDLPYPLEQAFHLPSWELRDANWSPDFPAAARQAEFFLDRERGIKVTGVIAIDPFLIERLLAVVGPIKIAETGDIVDQHNFFSMALYRTELDLTAGRKNFVVAAGKEIVARALSLPPSKWPELLQAVQWGCMTRSIQAYFQDAAAQALSDRHACGGEVGPRKTDTLMVVESNLGGNKDDFWMKRTYTLEVAVNRDGSAMHTLTLHYYGLSQHELLLTQYHGYTGWLRVYLPPSASLVSVSGAALDQTTDLGRRVVQGWFYVKFDQTADVAIVYDVDAATMQAQGHEVSIYWQKQAGRPADPIAVRPVLPAGWRLRNPRIGSDRVQGRTFTSDLSVDRQFTFDYGAS
jgi:hypothetical protein